MNLKDVRNLGVASLKPLTRQQRHLTESTSKQEIRDNDVPVQTAQTVPDVPMYTDVVDKGVTKVVTNINLKFEGEQNMSEIKMPTIAPMPNLQFGVAPMMGGTALGAALQLDIKVIGRVAKYGNCGTLAIDNNEAKKFYEENKTRADVIGKLKAANYSLPKVKADGSEDPVNKEIFKVEPKENKFSIGRFRILFPNEYKALTDKKTYKVDMSADNVEFYVFQSNQNGEDYLVEAGKIVSGNVAFLRKAEVFELMRATLSKTFKIATEDNVQAELFVGTSKKTKEGKEDILPALKITSGEKMSVKLASLAVPYITLRDRSDKTVTLTGECINAELFHKHYPGEALPVHPQITLEKKTDENAEKLAEIKKAMEIPFEEQPAEVLAKLNIDENLYGKLLKPGSASNIKQRVLKEQTAGFQALLKQQM